MSIKSVAFLNFFLLLGLLSACQEERAEPLALSGQTMGTTYHIRYIPGQKTPKSEVIHKKIQAILAEVNQEMSTYISDSSISDFNFKTSAGEWFKLPEMFYEVITGALEIAHLTEGVFDPTVGPLVNLWGFGPTGERRVPDTKKLQEVLGRVGYDKLKLDLKNKKLMKLKNGIELDLSAIAKGFGVDKVAQTLEENTIVNYMVEIGGEIRTKGSKHGSAWRIAIEVPSTDPFSKEAAKVLKLGDMALATSGSYRNFFESEGKRYSHTINLKTGRPVEDPLISVSVLDSRSCMSADALATALMAMGYQKAKVFAQKHKLAVYFIYLDSSKEMVHPISDWSAEFDQMTLYKPGQER